jgi:hypothetical protein
MFYGLSNLIYLSDKMNMMIKLSHILTFILSLRVKIKIIIKNFII